MCDTEAMECNQCVTYVWRWDCGMQLSCVTYVWRVVAEGLKISEHVPHILEWHTSYLFLFIFLTLHRTLSSFFKCLLRLILFDIVGNININVLFKKKKKKKIGTLPSWIQRFRHMNAFTAYIYFASFNISTIFNINSLQQFHDGYESIEICKAGNQLNSFSVTGAQTNIHVYVCTYLRNTCICICICIHANIR